MKTVTVAEAKNQIEELVNDTNDNHQPILLSGTERNAVLIAEEDWNSIQETLYLSSIPGMVDSIIEGVKAKGILKDKKAAMLSHVEYLRREWDG